MITGDELYNRIIHNIKVIYLEDAPEHLKNDWEQSILLNSSTFILADSGTYIIKADDVFKLYILRNYKSIVSKVMSSMLRIAYFGKFVPNKGVAKYNMFNAIINRIRKQIFNAETEEYTEDSVLRYIVADMSDRIV